MQKGFSTILGILIGLLVIGGGVYFYLKSDVSDDTGFLQSQEEKDEWETYTNNALGYSISYPAGWLVEDDDKSQDSIVNPERAGKPDTDVPKEQLFIRLARDEDNAMCGQGGDSELNSQSVYDTGWKKGFGLIYWRTICQKKGPLFILISVFDNEDGDIDEKSRNIFETILSTIEFSNPTYEFGDIDSENEVLEDKVYLQTDKIFQYSNLYATKYDNDIFLVNIFSFENEYSGTGTYHLDLGDNTITKLDTPYLYKENGKLYGLRHYPLFSTADLTAETTQNDIDNLVSEKLDELSKDLGIKKDDIKTIGLGGVPIIHAIVKTEYNPESKEMSLLTEEEAGYPIYDFDDKTFKIGNLKYPTSEFLNIGTINKLNGNPTKLFGIEFNYNSATEILSLTY